MIYPSFSPRVNCPVKKGKGSVLAQTAPTKYGDRSAWSSVSLFCRPTTDRRPENERPLTKTDSEIKRRLPVGPSRHHSLQSQSII